MAAPLTQPIDAEQQLPSATPRLRLVAPVNTTITDEEFPQLDTWYVRHFKPVADRLVALVALVAFAPVMLVVAAAIRIKLGPEVLYRQARVGLDGQSFNILKFRSMDPDVFGNADRLTPHKSATDPRHSSFGRKLRSTSLDELPQLLNVIRGDMSLIGPRPELVSVAERYGLRSHPRHQVRPGITGAWQISEYRHELLHENMHVDTEYLGEVSPSTDLRILLSTVGAMTSRTGA